MSELVAIAYLDQRRAAEALDAMKRLQKDGALDLNDAVAVSKDNEGRIKIEGAVSRAAAGTTGGLVLGALVGMVFLSPVIGALFGAVAGGFAGTFADVQHIDDFVLDVGNTMPPGSSAILMLIDKADPDKTLAALRQLGGEVIRTSLPDDAEARIRTALGQSDIAKA